MDSFEQINLELQALSAQESRRKRLDAQIQGLHLQRAERQDKVDETARRLKKEQSDVSKLEGIGLRSLLFSLSGELEDRLSQERREALAAQCQHDQAVEDLAFLERRLEELIQERDGLKDTSKKLEALWTKKAQLLRQEGGDQGRRLAALDRALDQLERELVELDQAISAGDEVTGLLCQIQDRLDSARGWGTWDMIGGGLVATMVKHDHINHAQDGLSQLQWALSNFRTELADVSDLAIPSLQIGEFATFADYFFDGLFSDWYIQTGIKRTQEDVSELHMNLIAILRTLSETRQGLTARRQRLKAERAELLDQA